MSHRRTRPKGQERSYGLLVGTIKDGQMDPSGRSPHYEIWVSADGDYRIAVNVQSVDGSDVLAYFDPKFTSPTKLDLPSAPAGRLGSRPCARGPMARASTICATSCSRSSKMADIPGEGAGVTLANLLDAQIERAKADSDSVVLALGQFFQDRGSDETFGFSPERGVHDIHMMQGNSGSFADDNRVNGDGALFIRFTGGETVALFVRFTTESTSTDDSTGNPD